MTIINKIKWLKNGKTKRNKEGRNNGTKVDPYKKEDELLKVNQIESYSRMTTNYQS